MRTTSRTTPQSAAVERPASRQARVDVLARRTSVASSHRNRAGALLMAALVSLGALAWSGGSTATLLLPPYSSRVDATVVRQSDGRYLYSFTVHNTTACVGTGECGTYEIVDWELPLFSLADIDVDSISDPSAGIGQYWVHEIIRPDATTRYYNNLDNGGPPSFAGNYGHYRWNWTVAGDPLLATAPDLYGPNPEVFGNPPWILHWVSADRCREGGCFPRLPILPGGALGGFEFISDYPLANAPYLSSWYYEPPFSGDPPTPGSQFGTPSSPARQLAQGQGPGQASEPASLALVCLALAGLALERRRRG